MFEFDFALQKEEECEECLNKDYLVDAIIDGKQKQICQRCVVANGAIVLKKPNQIQLDLSHRPSVRETIIRASGIVPKPIQPSARAVKLEDLRERYEETKKKKAEEQARKQREFALVGPERKEKVEVLDEKEFINYIEKIPQEQTTRQTQFSTQTMQQTDKSAQLSKLDFSIEAAKRTRIRDLLERMKRVDEEEDAKEKEKINKALARKMEEKLEGVDSAGYEEKI